MRQTLTPIRPTSTQHLAELRRAAISQLVLPCAERLLAAGAVAHHDRPSVGHLELTS